jgi:hypothetical protein
MHDSAPLAPRSFGSKVLLVVLLSSLMAGPPIREPILDCGEMLRHGLVELLREKLACISAADLADRAAGDIDPDWRIGDCMAVEEGDWTVDAINCSADGGDRSDANLVGDRLTGEAVADRQPEREPALAAAFGELRGSSELGQSFPNF